MYNQYVSLAQLQPEDLLVQEQIRQRIARQQFVAESNNRVGEKRQRVLIAANRLPITLNQDPETGTWIGTRSTGGLVSGLSAVKGFDMIWIGWPGLEVPDDEKPAVLQICQSHSCYPVWLSQNLIDLYYNGFANNVIWPLFHYVMPPLPLRGVNESTQKQWQAYQEANGRFAEAIIDCFREDDFVWVHDYHLMLVPKLLRDKLREMDILNVNIGW